MVESSPYKVIKDKPLEVPVREWDLPYPWLRYFPIGVDNVVTFAPPWKFPSIKVSDKKLAERLVALIKWGLKVQIISWILFSIILTIFFHGNPFYPVLLLGGIWGIRCLIKYASLVPKALRILKGQPVIEKAVRDRYYNAAPKSRWVEVRFLVTMLLMGLSWTVLYYWWNYEDILAYISSGVFLLLMVAGIYSQYQLNVAKGRKAFFKYFMTAGYVLLVMAWGVGCNFIISPPKPKEMGRWGYLRSSPSSEVLGLLQKEFSPRQLDRMILGVEYRSSGARMEWSSYLMSSEEFNRMKDALLVNDHDIVIKELKEALTEEESDEASRRAQRESFPYWWKLEQGMSFMKLELSPRMRQLSDSKEIAREYADGVKMKVSMDYIRPSDDMRYEIYFNPKTSRMFFLCRQVNLSPLRYIIR